MEEELCRLLFALGMPWEVESVISVVLFSFGQLENDEKRPSVDSLPTKCMVPVVPDWVLEATPVIATVIGTREGKIFSMRLE